MSNDLSKKVKSLYIIEVKYKTKYRKFVAISFTTQTNFVIFKGAEVKREDSLLSLESIEELIKQSMKNGDYMERYFPWSSITEVQVKRYEINK